MKNRFIPEKEFSSAAVDGPIGLAQCLKIVWWPIQTGVSFQTLIFALIPVESSADNLKKNLIELFLESTSYAQAKNDSPLHGKVGMWQKKIQAAVISDSQEDADRFRFEAANIFDRGKIEWGFDEKTKINSAIIITSKNKSQIDREYGGLIKKFFQYKSGYDHDGYEKFLKYTNKCVAHAVFMPTYEISGSVAVINSEQNAAEKQKCRLIVSLIMIGFVGVDREGSPFLERTAKGFQLSSVGDFFVGALYRSGLRAGDGETRIRPTLEKLVEPLKVNLK